MKLKINRKEYKGTLTWENYKKIQAGFSSLPELPEENDPSHKKALDSYANRGGDLTIDNIWMCLNRKWYFFKPYFFKWILRKKISLADIKLNRDIIINEMNMEISETGNPPE